MTISPVYDEAVSAEQTALVELFEMHLPAALSEKFPELAVMRFYKGLNELSQPVVWKGNTFVPLPIEAEGFEVVTKGTLPRPSLVFANVDALGTGLVADMDDLVGVTVKRLRTFAKFLDAVNFADGNPDANPNYELPTERYVIERKVSETNTLVSFELASSMDLHGVKIPLRQINRNVCAWEYRGDGCFYAGPAVADEHDAPLPNTLNSAEKLQADKCSHSYKGCRLRFPGAYDELPFGGFPGSTLQQTGD